MQSLLNIMALMLVPSWRPLFVIYAVYIARAVDASLKLDTTLSSLSSLHSSSLSTSSDSEKGTSIVETNQHSVLYPDYEGRLIPLEEIVYLKPKTVIVSTENGAMMGSLHKHYRKFLGIPYGQSPVGPRRWRAPLPAKALPVNFVFNATFLGHRCYQSGPELMELSEATPWYVPDIFGERPTESENCLNLDIYMPNPKRGKKGTNSRKPIPVLVYLFGGGFDCGSGTSKETDPTDLVSHNNVIVVTPNARIGVLGYLASKELAAEFNKDDNMALGTELERRSFGNYGVWDNIMALRWVKRNIAYFGGDPENITLMGFSAGSITAAYMQLALTWEELNGKDLVHRIIMHSGAVNSLYDKSLSNYNSTQLKFDRIAENVNCTGPNANAEKYATVMDCMRDKTPTELNQLASDDNHWRFQWGPVHDGVLYRDEPKQMATDGNFLRVPVFATTSANEGSIFAIAHNITNNELFSRAISRYFNKTTVEELLQMYPVMQNYNVHKTQKVLSQLCTDGLFYCPTVNHLSRLSKYVPVYYHKYVDTFPILQMLSKRAFGLRVGSWHPTSILYFFNSIKWLTYGSGGTVQAIREQMLAFIQNGDLSGTTNRIPKAYRVKPFSLSFPKMSPACLKWDSFQMRTSLLDEH